MQPGNSGTSATNESSSSLQKMITSYRLLIVKSHLVPQQNVSDLLHLVRLRFRSLGLQIDYLYNPFLPEDMVVSLDSPRETQGYEQGYQIREGDVRVGASAQDRRQNRALLLAGHVRLPLHLEGTHNAAFTGGAMPDPAGTLLMISALTSHARAQLSRRPVQRIVGLPLQSHSDAA